MKEYKLIDGGVTAPKGFKAAGIYAGIKASGSKPDMALVLSDQPAVIAGTFTTNKVQAAPVKLCKEILANKQAQAIVINSGNANACTGQQGMADAKLMAKITANQLGIDEQLVLVCSTGTIGVPLPMDIIEPGIKTASDSLLDNGGDLAAKAIMTTDTVDKQIAIEIEIDNKSVIIGGMTKGAGMISPDMATMLAFITTDAAIEPGALQACISSAVSESFNKITIDGDQSTNDTVLCLANGLAKNNPLNEKHPEWDIFKNAIEEATKKLALKIVEDGEGATKLVIIKVEGAASIDDARKASRAVANSALVKTSWFGCDPNWGRIIDAVGYSGADVQEELVDITYDNLCAVKGGLVAGDTSLKDLEEILKKDSFTITINLNLADNADTVYTCDLSEEYVRINSEYTT